MFPLVSDEERAPLADYEWEFLLYFRAQRIHSFHASGSASTSSSKIEMAEWANNREELLDHVNKRVGILRDTLVGEPGEVELIAISSFAFTRDDGLPAEAFPELYVGEFGLEQRFVKVCEGYNVLAIERKDGIAYRTGLGRVKKDA